MKKNKILIIFVLAFLATVIISCKKKKTNDALLEESKSVDLSFYKSKDTIYSPAGGSPHGNFKLKFNSQAVSKLDPSGKLPAGGSFDDGALIVKEIYSGTELTLYAVMKKDRKSKFSSKGWLWAEYEPSGKVVYNVSSQGKACTSCHSSSDKDLTRSFDLH